MATASSNPRHVSLAPLTHKMHNYSVSCTLAGMVICLGEEEISFPPTYRIAKGSRDRYVWEKLKTTGVSKLYLYIAAMSRFYSVIFEITRLEKY